MTSTTTPAPCKCEPLPDVVKVVIRSSFFVDYAKQRIPQQFQNHQIGWGGDKDAVWTIGGKPVVFLPEEDPFSAAINALGISGSVPMTFVKITPTELRGGCPAYVSMGNHMPKKIPFIFNLTPEEIALLGGNKEDDFFNFKGVTMMWMGVLLLVDDVWTIKLDVMKGNIANNNLEAKVLQIFPRDTDCPDYMFRYTQTEEILQGINMQINEIDVDLTEAFSIKLPPFKNSVLGY